MLLSGVLGRGLLEERLNCRFLCLITLKKAGEFGDSEQVRDEWLRGGEANCASALVQAGGMAHEQAQPHAIHTGDFAQIQDQARELVLGVVERGFQRQSFLAGRDAARALNDKDISTEACFESQGHRNPLSTLF